MGRAHPAAHAVRARFGQQGFERFALPPARDFDQPRPGAPDQAHIAPVSGERVAEGFENTVPVRLFQHVDEVDQDEPADIPQAKLPRRFSSRLQVGPRRGVLEASAAREPARVDVHGGQRLRRLDHQLAARGQADAGAQSALDFLLDLGVGEDVLRAGVKSQAVFSLGMNRPQ